MEKVMGQYVHLYCGQTHICEKNVFCDGTIRTKVPKVSMCDKLNSLYNFF